MGYYKIIKIDKNSEKIKSFIIENRNNIISHDEWQKKLFKDGYGLTKEKITKLYRVHRGNYAELRILVMERLTKKINKSKNELLLMQNTTDNEDFQTKVKKNIKPMLDWCQNDEISMEIIKMQDKIREFIDKNSNSNYYMKNSSKDAFIKFREYILQFTEDYIKERKICSLVNQQTFGSKEKYINKSIDLINKIASINGCKCNMNRIELRGKKVYKQELVEKISNLDIVFKAAPSDLKNYLDELITIIESEKN